LYDFYGLAHVNPEEYLRYVIFKVTGETLVIKNKALIAKIKAGNYQVLDALLEVAPKNLASIFLRYKPLFLAMKSLSKNKTFFNSLRRQSVYAHEPKAEDYLNTVTSKIETGDFKKREFMSRLEEYPVWRKIRLAHALSARLSMGDSVMYKVRNGKSWVTDYHTNTTEKKIDWYDWALGKTIESISQHVSEDVKGRLVYIPSEIHYALPATEKQFTGNVPSNTYVELDGDAMFGVHWYDGDNASRVDIDLSLVSAGGKIGWDAGYRTGNRDVLFSGDVTAAPRPKGASELFYVSKELETPYIVLANHFNFYPDRPVECQFVVSCERPNTRNFDRNYALNPNNIVLSENVTINKKQNVVGLVVPVDGKTRVYFNESGLGNSLTAKDFSMLEKTRDYLLNACLNTLELRTVLESAGCNVVGEIPDGDYIDLSPAALTKTTIIDLFSDN
jgi:hypothetical protein